MYRWIDRQASDYGDVGVRCERTVSTDLHVADNDIIDDSNGDVPRRIGGEEVCVFAP